MANKDWKDTDGTIVSVDPSLRWNTGAIFTYEVGGHLYSGTYLPSETVSVGDIINVRYDPKNPERNDLVEKEARRKWIIGICIGVVIAIAIVCFMN